MGSTFFALSGSEENISGGTGVGSFFRAGPGSVLNISGGDWGRTLQAESGSIVNISGGNFGGALSFEASEGSFVNLSGSEFSIDGTPVSNLQPGQPVTITDRDVTLSGVLADGEPFSVDLDAGNPYYDFLNFNGFFSPDASLTLTLEVPFLLGDVNQDGVVDFFDIAPFVAVLTSQSFQAEADIDQNGVVNFFDIQPFIDILS